MGPCIDLKFLRNVLALWEKYSCNNKKKIKNETLITKKKILFLFKGKKYENVKNSYNRVIFYWVKIKPRKFEKDCIKVVGEYRFLMR